MWQIILISNWWPCMTEAMEWAVTWLDIWLVVCQPPQIYKYAMAELTQIPHGSSIWATEKFKTRSLTISLYNWQYRCFKHTQGSRSQYKTQPWFPYTNIANLTIHKKGSYCAGIQKYNKCPLTTDGLYHTENTFKQHQKNYFWLTISFLLNLLSTKELLTDCN
jgi:hypothetical protein